MTDYIYKYPRLYLNASFSKNAKISLLPEQAHYLKNVLRKAEGDTVRVFNGIDGEWLARLDVLSKKTAEGLLTECIKEQPAARAPIHLYFSPIKKQRMDMLVEKAVELGVTDLHPVLMNRTENRKMNVERTHTHIIEAAQQCERLDIPRLHDVTALPKAVSEEIKGPIYAALERESGAVALQEKDVSKECAFLIGPEGGFDDAEKALLLSLAHVFPVSLGTCILRAETAAIACLSYAMISTAEA